jgi:hypothetical protein
LIRIAVFNPFHQVEGGGSFEQRKNHFKEGITKRRNADGTKKGFLKNTRSDRGRARYYQTETRSGPRNRVTPGVTEMLKRIVKTMKLDEQEP